MQPEPKSDISELVSGLVGDRSDAQHEIFDTYYKSLVRLLRGNIRGRIARRVEASDVVQSAMRSFFAHAQKGNFELQRREQLWKLLVTIALNKLRNAVRFHGNQKRGVLAEEDLPNVLGEGRHTPGPEDVAALNEELENVLAALKPYHRVIAQQLLAGQSVAEIAHSANRSARTIRRVEIMMEQKLVDRFDSLRG